MKTLKTALMILLCSAALCTLGACQKDGTFEKAGERVDEIKDNIADGENPLHKKGPMEKAGEAVDRAVGADERR